MALSSCEAETMAGTLAAQDVLFINNLLREILGDEYVLQPSFVYGDNVASLFLAQNNSVGQRTKHIDLRHRFLHDLVEKGQVELRHVRSEDNVADINSKNIRTEAHVGHAAKLYEGLPLVDIHGSSPDHSRRISNMGDVSVVTGNGTDASFVNGTEAVVHVVRGSEESVQSLSKSECSGLDELVSVDSNLAVGVTVEEIGSHAFEVVGSHAYVDDLLVIVKKKKSSV